MLTLQQRPVYRAVILGSIIVALISVFTGARIPTTGQVAEVAEPNLLINGNFDELPFQWRYPNHYIAGGWTRWWIDGTVMPEFDDVNKPNGVRAHVYVDGGHAQVYFKWGSHYTAGLFQVVAGLTPCRPYELTMHARTHSVSGAHPGTRIGLDPLGQQLTADGGVTDQTPLARAVWSREQTELSTWDALTVTAEPQGNGLTAILYAAPRPGAESVTHFYDTFWDAGALRPTTYAGGRLPAPSRATTGFIYDVTATDNAGSVTVNWKLDGPGTTQVWYDLITSNPITHTTPMSYAIHLPLISDVTLSFDHTLPVNYDATQLSHSATITDVTPGQSVNYLIVARRLVDDACITEYAGPYTIVTQP